MKRSHRFIIRAIAFISAITLLPLFVACGTGEQKETSGGPQYHTVTFNTNGGSTISSMEVRHGSMATAPKDPTLENYVFCRWQTTEGRAFFFEYYTVDSDLNLEAIWIKATELFSLEPMPDSDGIMITKIKRQEEFNSLLIPSVINGKTVEGIGMEAFASILDTHAKEIIFPSTIRYVEEAAFCNISETELVFNGSISHIEESAFEGAITLKKIKLGTGILTIPFSAFAFCTELKSIDIPEGVTTIEENAFESCSALRTVVLPSTLTLIENGAFDDCDAIKSVFFKGTQEQFDAITFSTGNNTINGADLYLFSEEEPIDAGNYWHYDKNGSPVIW